MRSVSFHSTAFKDFTDWAKAEPKTFERLTRLLVETARDPFQGLGKPEPLRHSYKGCWSRRITDEHRLVYKVTDDAIIVIGCKYHYE